LAQGKLVEKLMSFLGVRDVHDEHDPAVVLLDVPLVDFSREI